MVEIIRKTRHKELDIYFDKIDQYYRKTLEVLGKEDVYDLSLVITGPIAIHRINRDYRNIDRVTDVISFALQDAEDDFVIEGENIELGDIFININRVFSQAEDYGHSVEREFIFLFVHGLLHLFGYDHMNEKDEEVMFGLQRQIVGDLK